jgi:peptidoglycan/LPS O-acetylase OafA/YrhL
MVIVGHSPILNGESHYWADPITYLFPFAASGSWAVNLFFFISILYVAAHQKFNIYRPIYDVSFGVYLWGFVVQQTLYHYSGNFFVGWHCALSLVISFILAYITHFLIEKPGINLGKNLAPFTNTVL